MHIGRRQKRYSVTCVCLGMLLAPAALLGQPLPEKPPIPADNPMTDAKVALGKQLYFDTRLSADKTVSCNTCHDVMGSGTDNLPTSKGIGSQKGGRNAPTVWNAAFLSVQFWDGRAPSLEEQAKGPIVNPVEMGMKSHPEVIARLKTIPGYVKSFGEVFGGTDPLTIDNVAKAIAAYERTLVTPNAPYDRHLAGDQSALSAQAAEGLKEFQGAGCLACHSGPILAGPPLPAGQGFYMKFPLMPGSPYDAKYNLAADKGRADVTKNAADADFWRVPTLRNVALTAPYFHNGSVGTLPEAVHVMAKTQVNRDLTDDQAAKIVAFLESLTGERPKQEAPKLP